MEALSAIDSERMRQWATALDQDVTLRYATAGHTLDKRFKAFADQLAGLTPRINLKKDTDAQVPLPTLFVGRHTAYHALPLDRELEPFLTAMGDPGAFSHGLPVDVREMVDRLQVPALVKVYITPHCPFCPNAVSLLLGLAASSDRVRLSVIDGERFAEQAEKDRVSAAPTIILDDRFRWTGSVNALELVSMMLERDPAGLGADALRGLIEDGDADQVAQMMVHEGKLFPAFFELLTHPRWPVRLGAMVAFESLAEMAPHLAAQVVDPLVRRFADVDDMVKGDLLHVLGESRSRKVRPFLKHVAGTYKDEEVCAAAKEAMEKLN